MRQMTLQDMERLLREPMFAVRAAALESIVGFKKKDWEAFLPKFLLHLANESPEYFNNFEFESTKVHDEFGRLFHGYVKSEVQEKTKATGKSVDVQLKRRIVELLPEYSDVNLPKDRPDEEKRLFSAYLFLEQPEWFLKEEFLFLHWGGTGWGTKIEQAYEKFRSNPAYRLE
jgi:hypothetical protein